MYHPNHTTYEYTNNMSYQQSNYKSQIPKVTLKILAGQKLKVCMFVLIVSNRKILSILP